MVIIIPVFVPPDLVLAKAPPPPFFYRRSFPPLPPFSGNVLFLLFAFFPQSLLAIKFCTLLKRCRLFFVLVWGLFFLVIPLLILIFTGGVHHCPPSAYFSLTNVLPMFSPRSPFFLPPGLFSRLFNHRVFTSGLSKLLNALHCERNYVVPSFMYCPRPYRPPRWELFSTASL